MSFYEKKDTDSIEESSCSSISKLVDVLPIKDLDFVTIGISSFSKQCDLIFKRIISRDGGYVCVANTHMIVEAIRNISFREVLEKADFIVPDGMPLVWLLSRCKLGGDIERVAGYDLVMDLCSKAEDNDLSVMFFGSSEMMLSKIEKVILDRFPNLTITGLISPPFRDLSDKENAALIDSIKIQSADIIFVSLGCPKQELWMFRNSPELNSMLVGVGGVFPILAGVQNRAPIWIRNNGLEWFFRLILEPRRLWRRYVFTNTFFIFSIFKSFFHKYMNVKYFRK